jgi:hypothetical protein
MSRPSYYVWMEHDADFAASVQQCKVEAIDRLEAEARQRAVEGVRREKGVYYDGVRVATEVETVYSDTLLIFLLKGLAPEKYRERYDVRHGGEIHVDDTLSDEERAQVRAILTGRASGS